MKIKLLLTISLMAFIFFHSCKKDDAQNLIEGLPVVKTISSDSMGVLRYTIKCEVISEGDAVVTERGFVWTTDASKLPPTVNLNKVVCGAGVGEYTCNLDSVEPGLNYYLRAYAKNDKGVSYGQTISFYSSLALGKPYRGGIIGYIFKQGDSMFVQGETHGIIITPNSISFATWGCKDSLIGGTKESIGSGAANTSLILNKCNEVGIAARICDDYTHNGYSDWHLPSIEELLACQSVVTYSLFAWSSSEVTNERSKCWQCGGSIGDGGNNKLATSGVFATRYF